MKKLFGITIIAILIACLCLCVGCDRNEYVDKKHNATVDNHTSGLPEDSITVETDSEGNTVVVEDTITDDLLENPEKYNGNTDNGDGTSTGSGKPSANSSTTSSAKPSTNTSSNNSSVDSSASSSGDSGVNIDGTQEKDDPNYNKGWYLD